MVNHKTHWYIVSTINVTLVTAKLSGWYSFKPFIVTLRTIICFGVTIIDFSIKR